MECFFFGAPEVSLIRQDDHIAFYKSTLKVSVLNNYACAQTVEINVNRSGLQKVKIAEESLDQF